MPDDVKTPDAAETMSFRDAQEWESWLAEHFDLQAGVWLKVAKKHSGIESVTIPEAIDIALCYGWIDGQRKRYDDVFYLQRFVPRRPRSLWSKINIRKVEALMAARRMKPSGIIEVNAAKADGRWAAAYDSPKDVTVPPDLALALQEDERANDAFFALKKSERYSVLWQLMTARTPEGRSSRLAKLMERLRNRDAQETPRSTGD